MTEDQNKIPDEAPEQSEGEALTMTVGDDTTGVAAVSSSNAAAIEMMTRMVYQHSGYEFAGTTIGGENLMACLDCGANVKSSHEPTHRLWHERNER